MGYNREIECQLWMEVCEQRAMKKLHIDNKYEEN
jgi:hypothetical protein